MKIRVLLAVAIACGVACDDSAEEEGPGQNNLNNDCFQCEDASGFLPDTDPDARLDQGAPMDTSGNNGGPGDVQGDGAGVDAVDDEPFVRPDLPVEDTSDAGEDVADTQPDPDPVEITGFHECYEWLLRVDKTMFTVKEDNIFVYFSIHNVCGNPVHVRTMHTSDFFAVGIQKDGEPWMFLPDCPGTGDPEERTFGLGEGWARGYLWSPTDFDARLERCGVAFEEGASYSVIGYGVEPLPDNMPTAWSDIFPMTDPIEIRLQY
jgi:hypothetical protein